MRLKYRNIYLDLQRKCLFNFKTKRNITFYFKKTNNKQSIPHVYGPVEMTHAHYMVVFVDVIRCPIHVKGINNSNSN